MSPLHSQGSSVSITPSVLLLSPEEKVKNRISGVVIDFR